jgi:alcohol dehydrogenase (cytochrome c)
LYQFRARWGHAAAGGGVRSAPGAKLWRFNLAAGVNAPPITYSVDGVQYIAVAAGGNFQMGFPYGDTIAIFKLAK